MISLLKKTAMAREYELFLEIFYLVLYYGYDATLRLNLLPIPPEALIVYANIYDSSDSDDISRKIRELVAHGMGKLAHGKLHVVLMLLVDCDDVLINMLRNGNIEEICEPWCFRLIEQKGEFNVSPISQKRSRLILREILPLIEDDIRKSIIILKAKYQAIIMQTPPPEEEAPPPPPLPALQKKGMEALRRMLDEE